MPITMQDIRQHETKDEKPDSPYCPKKSKAAYDLSLRGRIDRANITEKTIAAWIEHHTGYRATVTIPNHPWDITVDLDKPKRIEVKSSLVMNRSTYKFQNITPDDFDYLFIVFVTPTGTIEKWAHVADVRKLLKYKERYANGYSLYHTLDSDTAAPLPECFHDMEDFPDGKLT